MNYLALIILDLYPPTKVCYWRSAEKRFNFSNSSGSYVCINGLNPAIQDILHV